jgi:hypothetical protein
VQITMAARESLAACELLAEGLRTNPAVAPDAVRLLQPYLDAARARRESVARGQTVDRSGTTHTFRLWHGKQVAIGVTWLLMCAFSLALLILGLFDPGGLSAETVILAVGFGLVCLWAGICFIPDRSPGQGPEADDPQRVAYLHG